MPLGGIDEAAEVLEDAYLALTGTNELDVILDTWRNNDLTGTKTLEAGCGSGKLGTHFAYRNSETTLLDIDPEMLNRAEVLNEVCSAITGREPSVKYREGSVLDLPFGDNSFDIVFNEGVNEHFYGEERTKTFQEMARVSKGLVAVTVPNANCRDQSKRSEETVHTYKGMPEKEKPFTPKELKQKLREADLNEIQVKAVQDYYKRPMRLVGTGWITLN